MSSEYATGVLEYVTCMALSTITTESETPSGNVEANCSSLSINIGHEVLSCCRICVMSDAIGSNPDKT